jgi:hypothetical protein
MIDVGLYFVYTLFIIAVVAAIALPLVNALQSPASFLRSLYGIIALLVLFGISYAISDSSVKPAWAVQGISAGTSKLIGAGLITFYVVIIVAFLGLIFSEINKALK